jgi:hypothetical protein
VLSCERGGVYKPSKKKSKFEETGTRKCGCPFRLRGYFHSTNDWHLRVVNGKHNHEFDKVLEGHLMVGRLKPNAKALVEELTRNLVPPRNIMSTLRERSRFGNGDEATLRCTPSDETQKKGLKDKTVALLPFQLTSIILFYCGG